MPDKPKMQYYYRVDECKADSPFGADCLCWHDEGTGPLPDVQHADQDQMKKVWRVKDGPMPNLEIEE